MRTWLPGAMAGALLAAFMSGPATGMLDNRKTEERARPMRLVPVSFDDLPGWAEADQRGALAAFAEACRHGHAKGGLALGERRPRVKAGLAEACEALEALGPAGSVSRSQARAFFEAAFVPHRVESGPADGFLTGYYEPVLDGALERQGPYQVPVLGRPSDLVDLVDPAMRASANERMSAARRLADGQLVPYFDRAEIEGGALAGRDLELLYLTSAVDLFFMQVQGSGRVRLPDGGTVKLSYAGKSGHPYTSIGGVLVSEGMYSREEMSLATLRSYLDADAARARKLMQKNRSYVFFRRQPDTGGGPIGASQAPLTAGHSLAVDTAYHMLGSPIYVVAPEITHHGEQGFRRLMIAQDVGSAIKGPERGDIFWGSGKRAEELAGETKHSGRFYVLLPRRAVP